MTRTIASLKRLNPWHFIWVSAVISEIFTALLNVVQSYLWFGSVSGDLMLIGAIDALFVPLIAAPIAIYFVKETRLQKEINAGLAREITERRRAEEALARNEARYRAMIDAFDGFIYICSADYRIEFMNDRLKVRTGRDATGESCFTALHERDSVCPWCVNERVLKGETVRWEVKSPKDDRWYFITNTPISNADGTVSKQAMIIDITERKIMEEELLNARKLESVGMLAGGIAHDFNNLLSGILSNIELAKMHSVHLNKVYERLEEAEQATIMAKDLTQQLLTFAKGGAPVKRTLALGALIRESARLAVRRREIKCECSVPEDLWPIDADEGQMNQVFSNMIMNADHAMPEGGTISVLCENLMLGESDVPPLPGGSYVRISIRDQGIGIAQDFLSRIFDPYFTTKNRGSGLGLATSYSIISKHQGHITVESELGKGTVFHIYLPASEAKNRKSGEEQEWLTPGEGRILVMDDDDIIRDAIEKILQALGYEAVLTREGNEALAVYREERESGRAFEAIILDLTVPGGMGGRETGEKLLALDPAARIIISSGYSSDPVMANYRSHGFHGVVAKPYRIKDLGEVLHQVIQEER